MELTFRSKHGFQTSVLPESASRRQMETFFASLALSEGNPSVTGGFPPQRPVTRSYDVFFDLRLNEMLTNNREAGDLMCHRYNVTLIVMRSAEYNI